MPEQLEEEKAVQKAFRLKPDEDARLDKLIQIAHLTGQIPEPTLQSYVMWSLSISNEVLKRIVEKVR